jgi:hypothetical protein
MNRRTRHSRLFARLALLAALLLAGVPTLGRLLTDAPAPASPTVPMAHAMAMPMGMHAMGQMATVPRASHRPTPSAPPHAGHVHDEDCAYCPLLGAMLAAHQVLALDIPASGLPHYVDPQIASAPRPARPPGTRGSRGPPHTA